MIWIRFPKKSCSGSWKRNFVNKKNPLEDFFNHRTIDIVKEIEKMNRFECYSKSRAGGRGI